MDEAAEQTPPTPQLDLEEKEKGSSILPKMRIRTGHNVQTYAYEYIYGGQSAKAIAQKYGLNEKTIKTYMSKFKQNGLTWYRARKQIALSRDFILSAESRSIERAMSFAALRSEVGEALKMMKVDPEVTPERYIKSIKTAAEVLKMASEIEIIEDDLRRNHKTDIENDTTLDRRYVHASQKPVEMGIILNEHAYEGTETDDSPNESVQLTSPVPDSDGGSSERENNGGSNLVFAGTD